MLLPSGSSPRQNQLLAALPQDEYRRLSASLERIFVAAGEVINEPGAEQNHLLFPTSCIVSLLYTTESGAATEIALAGREGLVGAQLFMGGVSTLNSSVALHAGEAYRLPTAVLRTEIGLGGKLQTLVLRYIQALLTQIAQTAVCYRHHQVDQQLCRWLLLILDRRSSNELPMTREIATAMLGVRREAVADAANQLQKKGMIDYCRGRITAINRAKLEAGACECYAVVKEEYDRLLPQKLGKSS